MLGKLTVSDAEAYLKSLGFDHNESTELTVEEGGPIVHNWNKMNLDVSLYHDDSTVHAFTISDDKGVVDTGSSGGPGEFLARKTFIDSLREIGGLVPLTVPDLDLIRYLDGVENLHPIADNERDGLAGAGDEALVGYGAGYTLVVEANHFQAISDDGTWVDFDMTTREILLRWKR